MSENEIPRIGGIEIQVAPYDSYRKKPRSEDMEYWIKIYEPIIEEWARTNLKKEKIENE